MKSGHNWSKCHLTENTMLKTKNKKKHTKAQLMKTCIQCNNVKSSFWIGTYERSTCSKSKPQSLGLFHLSLSAMYIVFSNKRCPLQENFSKIAAFGTKKINQRRPRKRPDMIKSTKDVLKLCQFNEENNKTVATTILCRVQLSNQRHPRISATFER